MLGRLLAAAAITAAVLGAAGSASALVQQRSIPGGGVDQQQVGLSSTTTPRIAGVELTSGDADAAWLTRPSTARDGEELAGGQRGTGIRGEPGPGGSVVEKWDSTRQEWTGFTATPQTSPRALMRLLAQRLVNRGDAIRWVPPASAPAAQRAFSMSDWVRAGMPVPTITRPLAGTCTELAERGQLHVGSASRARHVSARVRSRRGVPRGQERRRRCESLSDLKRHLSVLPRVRRP